MKRARLALSVLVLVLAGLPAIGYAQTGRLKGKVIDADSKPVEGAVITIENKEMNAKRTTKTDKRGDYTQFLPPGPYIVTAAKDKLSATQETRVSLDEKELNFTLKPTGPAPASEADRKKAEAEMTAVKTAFSDAVTLSNEGKFDEAIAKFNEVVAKVPKCTECQTNIGAVYFKKKDYDQSEAAYKKAIEVNPQSAEAYMGLANVYNAQKKFDQATEAGAQAQKLLSATSGTAGAPGAGPNAGNVYNQGVIAWNAGKIPDAQKLFEEAVALDPKLADAHYWLGMANVNQGKLPEGVKEFEEYMKLAPTGQYAEQAKSMIAAIKK
jgi:tetratricopeptide (TPR) repeat protein